MPLSGGATDKFGNRYEGRWTVACLAEVMGEQAEAIRLEPPGPEGQGVEFWVQRGPCREYHQVKRQQGSRGHWTLTQLGREGVLYSFWEKLRDPSARCVFVSMHAADQLQELADRSRHAASCDEYDRDFLKARQKAK